MMSLYADDLFTYKILQNLPKNLLELRSEFGKATVHKIGTHPKMNPFPYTNREHADAKIKNTMLFTVTAKKMKYLDTPPYPPEVPAHSPVPVTPDNN